MKNLSLILLLSSGLFMGSAYADAPPSLSCTLTDQLGENNTPGPAVSTFTPANKAMYLICTSTNAVQGQVITADYYYDDAPTEEDRQRPGVTKSVTVNQDASTDQPFVADLSPPPLQANMTIPSGRQHITIRVGNDVVETIPFDINNNQ